MEYRYPPAATFVRFYSDVDHGFRNLLYKYANQRNRPFVGGGQESKKSAQTLSRPFGKSGGGHMKMGEVEFVSVFYISVHC